MRRAHRPERVAVKILVAVDLPAPVRFARAEHRIVLRAEIAPERTGPAQALAVPRERRQTDIGRQSLGLADAEILANRPHARVVGRLGVVVLAVAAAREAGHDRVGIVAVVTVRERANQAEMVQAVREHRHVLGEAEAGDRRGDRAKLAANLRRGAGLGIEGVDVARPAEQINEDDRLRPAKRAADGTRGSRQSRNQPGHRQRAGREQLPAIQAVTGLGGMTQDSKHGNDPAAAGGEKSAGERRRRKATVTQFPQGGEG